jgi:hypothetical protein
MIAKMCVMIAVVLDLRQWPPLGPIFKPTGSGVA